MAKGELQHELPPLLTTSGLVQQEILKALPIGVRRYRELLLLTTAVVAAVAAVWDVQEDLRFPVA
jgi:hypothetical protein